MTNAPAYLTASGTGRSRLHDFHKAKPNTWLEQNREKWHGFDSTKPFTEQLWGMPYVERCIVLGIVMGEPYDAILSTLNTGITADDLADLIEDQGLQSWQFVRAILDN